jgi:hypothetical protein
MNPDRTIRFPDLEDLESLDPGDRVEVEYYPERGDGTKTRSFTVDGQGTGTRVRLSGRWYLDMSGSGAMLSKSSTKTYQLDSRMGRVKRLSIERDVVEVTEA